MPNSERPAKNNEDSMAIAFALFAWKKYGKNKLYAKSAELQHLQFFAPFARCKYGKVYIICETVTFQKFRTYCML